MSKKFLLFLICCFVSRSNGRILRPFYQSGEDVFDEDLQKVNSTVAKTVTKFSCMADSEDAEVLVYGAKAWTFPEQDINLTLIYPPDTYQDDDDYVITGFKVLLFVDTAHSKGYINSGGLFEDYLSLSFVSPRASMLVYQFWLYGTPKSNRAHETSYIIYDLC